MEQYTKFLADVEKLRGIATISVPRAMEQLDEARSTAKTIEEADALVSERMPAVVVYMNAGQLLHEWYETAKGAEMRKQHGVVHFTDVNDPIVQLWRLYFTAYAVYFYWTGLEMHLLRTAPIPVAITPLRQHCKNLLKSYPYEVMTFDRATLTFAGYIAKEKGDEIFYGVLADPIREALAYCKKENEAFKDFTDELSEAMNEREVKRGLEELRLANELNGKNPEITANIDKAV